MTAMAGWSSLALAVVLVLSVAPSAEAVPVPVATYLFDDDLSAEEAGAPTLVSVDPLGRNGFESATVFGETRRVFRFDGARFRGQHAGLSLDASGLIPRDRYSVELVFEFFHDFGLYRRILDVTNQASDHGLYVNLHDRLEVHPYPGGPTHFTINEFHHVVLTNTDAPAFAGYLDGVLEITTASDVMNINNPGDLMRFFLDDGRGFGEYSSGRVALIRLYDRSLTEEDVAILAEEPFAPRGLLVDVDIRPGGDPNPINLKSKGLVPVAILTTDDVDAADIDPNTVTLGDDDGDDTAVATRKNGTLRASLEDVDGDTRDDLVLHFDTQTLIANGDITATSDVLILTGSTSDGTPFGGSDTVRVVPGGPGKAAAGGESTSWGELKRQTR